MHRDATVIKTAESSLISLVGDLFVFFLSVFVCGGLCVSVKCVCVCVSLCICVGVCLVYVWYPRKPTLDLLELKSYKQLGAT